MTVYATPSDFAALGLPEGVIERFVIGSVEQTGQGPTLTLSGTPAVAFAGAVEVVGVGAMHSLRYSLDGGQTWTNAPDGSMSFALGETGMRATLDGAAGMLQSGTRYAIGVSDAISPALSAASAEADGYLGARFRLPLTAWGDDLRQHVCSLAAYALMRRRGYNPDDARLTVIRLGREDAIDWLGRVSHGNVTPVVTETAPAALGAARVYSMPRRGW